MLGRTISHYRIVAKIGAGGMGVVYRAHDEQLERDVALKVLNRGTLANETARQRFRREALALGKLNHPNIETVYEFGSEDGVDFLVMELITGVALHYKLAGGALPEKEVLRLGAQLADGLEAAHAQGIIHRDLKPGNLHITKDDRLKILDFGLAQWIPAGDQDNLAITVSKAHEIIGTLPYMAPEQLRGQRADQRTDIYSAGAVLYEMATGKRPHLQTSGPQLISAILERPLTAPSLHNPQITPALDSIIVKALDKDPNRRYQSARELHIDLERLSSGLTPVVQRHNRRKGLFATTAAVVISALMLLTLDVGGIRTRLFHPAKLGQTAGATGGSTLVVSPIKARRSVAVLGFKNLSGKPDEAWISTALAEMLSTELAAGEQVRTIPGENIARMKVDLALTDADSFGKDSLTKIRTHLGTDLVVVGSYLAMGKTGGSKIRLDFRLQDAVAGETIASVSETGTENELLDLVSRSGTEIRRKLGIGQVSDSETSGVRASLPSNSEAARLYSEGLSQLQVLNALAARDLLQKAVQADPKHAPTHAALAEAWSALGYDSRAAAEAKRALDLSENLSREERLFVEGRYHEFSREWPKAIEIYHTLTGFFPDNLEYGLRLAASQAAGGSGKDALATLEGLRNLPVPARDDARIDLAEANAAAVIGDFKRSEAAAARAVMKGRAQGTQLVVAQARSRQGWAMERLGQSNDAAAALSEAQGLFTASGDRIGAASTLQSTGHLLYDQGNFSEARKAYEEALAVFRTLGNQARVAASLNNIGNIYYDHGDLVQARQYYEQSIAAYREIDDKSGLAGGLGNLANVLDSMGNLPEALKMQQAGLAAFREIDDQRGTASTLSNLGNLLVEMGDLEAAQKKYTEALEMDNQIGYKRGSAFALSGLADVLTHRGDLAQARLKAQDAANIRRDLGAQLNTALSQTQLATIALEEGHETESEGLIRAAATEFEKEKLLDNQVAAQALLTSIMLKQGRIADAQKAAEQAINLSRQSGNRLARFDAELANARTLSASGKGAEALQRLEPVLTEAKKYGYLIYEYQARFALGEAEMKSGKATAGRARLTTLDNDATRTGFLLIARKAEKAAS
jgi:serine/threonine protein kinase/tetratricopeptide (TPR) repeat protein/TolB-like protein